jgi:hypothetical protein
LAVKVEQRSYLKDKNNVFGKEGFSVEIIRIVKNKNIPRKRGM